MSHKLSHYLSGKNYLLLTAFLNDIGIEWNIHGYRIVDKQLFSLNIFRYYSILPVVKSVVNLISIPL